MADLAVQDPDAPVITNRKGEPEPDPTFATRRTSRCPRPVTRYEPDATGRLASADYVDAVDHHLTTEVHPYVPDAWIDHTKTKIGYEIPSPATSTPTSHPAPSPRSTPRSSNSKPEIQDLLREVTE